MDFDATTIIGLVAAFLTTAAFLPQVIKTWRTRQTRDISLGMFLVLCLGICLWLVYGLLRGDLPLILANTVTGAELTGVAAEAPDVSFQAVLSKLSD